MEKLYTTEEAAAYLKKSYNTIRYHIKVKNLIPARKANNSLLFTRKQLDQLKSNSKRPPKPMSAVKAD